VCATRPSLARDKTPQPKVPELKIRIVPSKEKYTLRLKVLAKTEFTNLTDKTLCFPEPSQPQGG
jgi:hypothetical protein